MKKAIFKIMLFCTLTAMLLPSFASCSRGGKTDTTSGETASAPVSDGVTETAAPVTVTLPDGTKALASGGFRLDFVKSGDGFGLNVTDASDGLIMFRSEAPAIVTVRSASDAYGNEFSAPYSSVTETDGGYVCAAAVKTDAGSEFAFEDTYTEARDGVFAVSRKVTVTKGERKDFGFRSVFSLHDPDETSPLADHDIFIPSILYKNAESTVAGAIGTNTSAPRVYVKETRTGLPLVMLRSETTRASVAVAHLHPEIDVAGILGGGEDNAKNEKLQYGSVGYTSAGGMSADFCYPSLEMPTVYYSGLSSRGIFHPADAGFSHSYSISITPARKDTYADAMAYTFREAYMAESPEIASGIDIDAVYDDTLEIFKKTYRKFGTGQVIAAGVPWSIDLKNGRPVEYTFQMGFVGQQTSVGFHLMRDGYGNGDSETVDKGRAIIDFWTSDSIMRGKVPIVWWDPVNNDSAGQTRGYPSFLRCFVDGMEGILDAYRLASAHGEENDTWLAALKKTADFLAENQNDDGSYYRAYFTNGKVCTDTSDRNFQGTSKVNTPVAIRFLARMYELTGEEKYKTAALRAADFSYEELYLGLEKYVGGTPDNANTVDKEASIYAMYGFNAAYSLTGDEKYLRAAEHAAVSAMSWVYCYDFACPSSDENAKINPFAEGRTSGFSIIATGHSGADNYSAFMYYEMFKLYVWTGDEFYLEASKLLELNTKLSTDYDGKMGWRYRALGPEASNVSDFDFGTVGVWLPWSGIANIEPVAYMEDTFGSGDILKLDLDPDALRGALDAYGAGGRPLSAD